MTDLQVGLLLAGAAVVAGVLVYNRLQERATRREAERAFGGARRPDALLEEPSFRREPTFGPPPSPAAAAADPRVDYVIALQGVSARALDPQLGVLARRFAGRVALGDERGTLHVALQMVNRSGVVGEAELLEFRSHVETIAASHGASVSAPPMREALEGAQALDRTCSDVDVQVALHVLGTSQTTLEEGEPFAVMPREGGVTLLLDVPRTPDLATSYAAMVKAARRLGGRVVDDNGKALDEAALSAIGAEVEVLRARLVEAGIEPGSPLALRVFS